MFKVYKHKIDIYLLASNGKFFYGYSTKASKTCKDAKKAFCEKYKIEPKFVKTKFDKGA